MNFTNKGVKIGVANINTTVGKVISNTDAAIDLAREMAANHCTIGHFPEMTIPGYPPEDFIQWSGFVDASWLHLKRFVRETAFFDFPTVFVIGLVVSKGEGLYNAVAVVSNGSLYGIVPKNQLPTYDVFYEGRTFTAGLPYDVSEVHGVPFGDLIFKFPFGTLAPEVCEDIWIDDGPMKHRSYFGADIVLNSSSSPFRSGVYQTRRQMVATRAADHQVLLVYTNQVGGNDSLVMDGGAFINQNGVLIGEAPRFDRHNKVQYFTANMSETWRRRNQNSTWRESRQRFLSEAMIHQQQVTSIDGSDYLEGFDPATIDQIVGGYKMPIRNKESYFIPDVEDRMTPQEFYLWELNQAVLMGLGDYFEKVGAFERIGIALSGGKDSVVTLMYAWQYANERFAHLDSEAKAVAIKDFIWCFSFPTKHNSDDTKGISATLCEELGVTFKEISIQDQVNAEIKIVEQMVGHPVVPGTLVYQNIQARIRAMHMWNWTNHPETRGFWIQTGNMSEKAVGYTTVGGDMMGAYSLIGNMPKTVVIAVLYSMAATYGFDGLKKLMKTKASAELADDQHDEDDLMPFPVLDECIGKFVGEKLMPVDVYWAVRNKWTDDELTSMYAGYRSGMLSKWVKRFVILFMRSIFKWVQAPEAVHLGTIDLDRERALQLAVVKSLEWLDLDKLDYLE